MANIHASRPTRGLVTGLVIGVVCGGVAIGVAQLLAGIVNPEASPIVTVGQSAIDASPEWLKSFAIRTFGSHDKLALLVGIGIVLGLLSIALGVVSVRRPRVGIAGLALFGLVGVAAALTRPAARPVDVVPVIGGTIAAAAMLMVLGHARSPVKRPPPTSERVGVAPLGQLDRRGFFRASVAGVSLAVLAGGVGNLFARRFRADASRAAVRIPTRVSRATTPVGLDLRVEGLSPFFTPSNKFYRVDTALMAPSVTTDAWRLRVHGMVDRELTLAYPELLARPMIERDITLNCVSNPVGGHYISNARWIGAPLKDLLEEAGVHAGADQMVARSVDGFTAGPPTALVMDGRDAMLAVAMNGEALPILHGFPVRAIVPGLYGYTSATKWLVDIELTTFSSYDAYWVQRGWSRPAPIKTESRIDTPSSKQSVHAGRVPIGGVAWAQHRGIQRVDVRVDRGPWMQAQLSAQDTIDTWRQWLLPWDASSGQHELQVRATDGTGVVQTDAQTPPFPSGATGYHTVVVQVA